MNDITRQQRANRRKKFKITGLRKEKRECHALLLRAQQELEHWMINHGEYLPSRALAIEIAAKLRSPHVVHETAQLRFFSDGDVEFKTGPISVGTPPV